MPIIRYAEKMTAEELLINLEDVLVRADACGRVGDKFSLDLSEPTLIVKSYIGCPTGQKKVFKITVTDVTPEPKPEDIPVCIVMSKQDEDDLLDLLKYLQKLASVPGILPDVHVLPSQLKELHERMEHGAREMPSWNEYPTNATIPVSWEPTSSSKK